MIHIYDEKLDKFITFNDNQYANFLAYSIEKYYSNYFKNLDANTINSEYKRKLDNSNYPFRELNKKYKY